VRQTLAAVSQAAAVRTEPAERCAAFLTDVLALNRDRFGNLGVVDESGGLRCSASPSVGPGQIPSVAAEPWFETVRRDRKPAIGPVLDSQLSEGGRYAVMGYPIVEGPQFFGALVATLRMDWLAGQSQARDHHAGAAAIWLAGPDRAFLPVGAPPDAELPDQATLAQLLATPEGNVEAVSEGGRPYSYAVAELSDGMRLLAGYDASADIAQGRASLTARFIELALLLLLGMLAVAAGVHVAVVEPIKRLTWAVGRWRGGGPFTPGSLYGVPGEVAELSNAFSQATGALAERESQLRAALSHQDLLMHEIHHRVKNNLQIIASLLNLQASRIRLPEARAEFQSARDRVRALATLHRHLYAHGELQALNMRSFLTELCGQLFQAMGETEGDRIHLEIDAPELQMSSDQAVPLALIVTETVSNAVKYAFPAGRSGRISVRMVADSELAHLVIEDNGVGIPASRSEVDGGMREGIGIQLIRGFARQLGAPLTVEEGNGTRYTAEIPLRPNGWAREDPVRRATEAHELAR
jgi:two-component sensor histidine kinase